MRKQFLLFLIILFSLISFSPEKSLAKVLVNRCNSVDLSTISYLGLQTTAGETKIFGEISFDKPTQITAKYIYDGYNWVLISSSPVTKTTDNISLNKKYNEAKDFIISTGWVYYEDGVLKASTCQNYLRVCDPPTLKNYGEVTLYYPQSTNKVITDNGKYICLVTPSYKQINWYGNNNGYLPLGQSGWSWKDPYKEVTHITGGVSKYSWDGGYSLGETASINYLYSSLNQPEIYLYDLKTSLDYYLSSPSFKDNQGNGAWAKYNFDNLWVYSRVNPKNEPPKPPDLLIHHLTLTAKKNLKQKINPPSPTVSGITKGSVKTYIFKK